MTDAPLFEPTDTHILVQCWNCGRSCERDRSQLRDGIAARAFSRLATCQDCGENHPRVTNFPRRLLGWGVGEPKKQHPQTQKSRPAD